MVGYKNYHNIFSSLIRQNKLAQTYLLVGPPQAGKSEFALWIARKILCPGNNKSCLARINNRSHSDFYFISPKQAKKTAKKTISLAQIKEAIRFLTLSKIANKKILIIKNCEYLSIEAANAFLKTLEEPVAGTLIILTTAASERILPTIASRTQKINFRLMRRNEIMRILAKQKLTKSKIELIANLAAGRPIVAKQLIHQNYLEEYSQELEIFFSAINQDISDKYQIAKKIAGNRQTEKLIKNWEILARDILLAKFNLKNLIININLIPQIIKQSQNLTTNQIIDFWSSLEVSIDLLNQNVSPQLILENLLLSIHSTSLRIDTEQKKVEVSI